MKYIFILNLSLCCCCWMFFVVVVFVFFRGWREGVGLNQIKWKKQDRLRAAGAVSMRQTALTFCCFVWQFSLLLYDRHWTGAMSDSFHCCCMTGMWLVRCLTAFIVVVWQTWDWWLVWCLFSLLLYDRCGTGGWCDVCFHCCCMTDMGLVRCLTAFIVVVWQKWDWWLVRCLFSLLYDRHGTGGWCGVCFHWCCMTDMGLVAGVMSVFIVVVWQTWDWWLVRCLFSLLLYDRHGTCGWCDVCFHCCCMTDMGLVAGAMSVFIGVVWQTWDWWLVRCLTAFVVVWQTWDWWLVRCLFSLVLYDRHGTGGWCDVWQLLLLYDRHGTGGWCDVWRCSRVCWIRGLPPWGPPSWTHWSKVSAWLWASDWKRLQTQTFQWLTVQTILLTLDPGMVLCVCMWVELSDVVVWLYSQWHIAVVIQKYLPWLLVLPHWLTGCKTPTYLRYRNTGVGTGIHCMAILHWWHPIIYRYWICL